MAFAARWQVPLIVMVGGLALVCTLGYSVATGRVWPGEMHFLPTWNRRLETHVGSVYNGIRAHFVHKKGPFVLTTAPFDQLVQTAPAQVDATTTAAASEAGIFRLRYPQYSCRCTSITVDGADLCKRYVGITLLAGHHVLYRPLHAD